MARPKYDRPTDAELAILNVLWEREGSTVRQVKEDLATSNIAESSVLKLMQIMVDKGLLKRDESKRPQVYYPAVQQDQTQRHLIRDLVKRAFAGSPTQLVMQLMAGRRISPDERQKVRAVLDKIEDK